MSWSLSFQLLPEEKVLDDSAGRPGSGVKASYSVFLTNRRAIFRFDSLGSSLTQSFFYHEIKSVTTSKRILIPYLHLKTEKKDCLLNVSEAEYWASRIKEMINASAEAEATAQVPYQTSPERRKKELVDMLTALQKNSLLTKEELEEKIRQIDSIKL